MFRPFRLRVWGFTALVGSALALVGAGLLTAQSPTARGVPQISVTRPEVTPTDARARARSKLLQGRAYLGQGNFELAEAIAAEVADLELSYLPSEDSPGKLTDDVKKAKTDPRALLEAARVAQSRQDYDRAEKYARLADRHAGAFTFTGWGDNPTRVLAEVQSARKLAGPHAASRAYQQEAPKSGLVQTSYVEPAVKEAPKPPVVKETPKPPVVKETPKPAVVKESPEAVAARAEAKKRLAQGRTLLEKGDFDGAEKVAQEVASTGKLASSSGDDTPAKLMRDAQKGRSDPKLLMHAGRAAFARKDYDQAEKYARLAEKNAGTFSFSLWGDSPSALLGEIEAIRKPVVKKEAPKPPVVKKEAPKAPVARVNEPREAPKSGLVQTSYVEPAVKEAPKPAVVKETPKPPVVKETPKQPSVPKETPEVVAARSQAKKQLAQGRTLLDQGDFDGAEKVALDVGAAGLIFPSGDDSPTKLLHDAQKGRSDPKLLVNAGRVALARKDYDQAEKYARLAEKNAGTFNFSLRGDSPSALLEDVQAARKAVAKQEAPKPPVVKKEAPVVKQPEKAAVKNDAPAKVEKKEAASPRAQANSDDKARGLIKQARTALQQGKLDEARTLTAQARELKPNLSWWEDNPGRLSDDIQRAQNARPNPKVEATANAKEGKAAPDVAADLPRTKEAAKAMLAKGREHLGAGRLDEAFAAAQNVKAARTVEWGLFEDSPDRLLIDVNKARTKRDREEADRLLVQGRKMLEKGDHEGAAKLAHRAQKLNSNYSIWDLGDRPSKLLADCQAAQARTRKTDLPPAVARKDDRPQAPVNPKSQPAPEPKRTEVAVNTPVPAPKQDVQQVTHVERQKPEAVLVSNTPPAPPLPPPPPVPMPDVPPPPAPAPVDSPNKLQAQQLVAEAQRLQREGKLLEARQKAVEAQRLNATFTSDEVSPELAYQQVANEARLRIDSLVRQAHEEALFGQGAVADRHQSAERRLGEAKQLATSFGHDVRVIDDKIAELTRQRDGAPNTPPVAVVNHQVPPAPAGQQPGNQGKLLLDNARIELRKGETKLARTMCEEVLKGKFGMQDEAVALLRSIDAEEFNQRALAANRTFEAATRAFNRGDKAQASAMIVAIDTRLLSVENQYRLREMALTPQMYSPPATGAGRATATDKGDEKQPLPVPPTGRLMRTGEDGMPGSAPPLPGGTQLTSGEGKATATDKGGDALDSYKQRKEILAQRLRRDGIDAQNSAADRLRAGDHDGAIEILTSYLASLEQQQLEPTQFTQLRRPIDARISQYRLLREQRELARNRNAPRVIGMDQVREKQNADELKKKNVEKLMREYNVLYREGKYPEASALAMRAHELDPDNAVVTSAIMLAKRHQALKDSKEIKESREETFRRALNANDKYSGLDAIENGIDVPRDVAERNKMRSKDGKGLMLGNKSPREKDIERKLSSPVRINFDNAPLKQVLNDLRDAHSINVVPDLPALQEAGISLDSPVTIQLDQVSLKSALNLILHQVKLTYVIKDEVLNVTTDENARGKLVPVTYPVADLVLPVDNFGDLQANTANQTNQVVGPAGGVLSPTNVNPYSPTPIPGRFGLLRGQAVGEPGGYPSGSNGPQPPATPTPNGQATVKSRVTNTMEAQLIKLITNSISPRTWSDNGGPGTIEYYPLTLALVVNQTPDIQEQIQDLLAALRRLQDQEVAIEVRFITVSEDFFERIGVNFNVNILTDSLTRKFEPALVNNAFVQDPNNFINNINFGRFLSGAGPGGTLTPTLDIPITNNSYFNTFPSYGRYIPGGGLAFGLAFLSDIQVFLFLEAVQGDVRSNLMQAPKLTMFNGQTATITASSFQSLVTNVLVIPNGDGTFLYTPQVTQQPSGISLTLQPAISADRRFVRVSLTPSFFSLKRDQITAVPITVPIFTNSAFQGGGGQPVLITQFIQTPNVVTLSVNTTVVVPDGGTVLMGGLKQLSEERSEYGPPILSKIPYVNRLFKNVGYGRSSDSLLIMVSPRIIIQEEEEERATGFRQEPFIQQ